MANEIIEVGALTRGPEGDSRPFIYRKSKTEPGVKLFDLFDNVQTVDIPELHYSVAMVCRLRGMDLLQTMFASYRRLHAAYKEPDTTKFIVEEVQAGKPTTEPIMFEYPGENPRVNPLVKFKKGPGETDEDLKHELAGYPLPESLPWVKFFTPYGIYSMTEGLAGAHAKFRLSSIIRLSDEIPGICRSITTNRMLPPDHRALLVEKLEEQLSVYPPLERIG